MAQTTIEQVLEGNLARSFASSTQDCTTELVHISVLQEAAARINDLKNHNKSLDAQLDRFSELSAERRIKGNKDESVIDALLQTIKLLCK